MAENKLTSQNYRHIGPNYRRSRWTATKKTDDLLSFLRTTQDTCTRSVMAPPSKKRKESDAAHRKPADKEGGVKYWTSRPATVDGVLGGFGTLSHADAMSSRMFLLTVAPHLSRIKGPGNSDGKAAATTKQKTRALDVGSGIGRVTSTVLLPLVDYVDIVEPTPHFVQEALRAAKAGEWKSLYDTRNMQEVKTVRFYELGLQDFRPDDVKSNESGCIGSIGVAVNEQEPAGYDIIWCQWCLGHRASSFQAEKIQCLKLFLK